MINGVFSRSSSFQKTKTSFFEEEECEITEGDEGGAITLARCNAILQKKTGKTDGEYKTEGRILIVAKNQAGNKFPPSACSDLSKANLLPTITESL